MYGDGDSDSDTDDDEWVSIFVLCMSVSRQSHSNFVFNASAADIFRCVSSVFYFGLVTTSSCRFFVFMRWFIYFIRLVSLFFFSQTRSSSSGFEGRQRGDDTHSRKSQTHTQARCSGEYFITGCFCWDKYISFVANALPIGFLLLVYFTTTAYSENVFICSRSSCISYSKKLTIYYFLLCIFHPAENRFPSREARKKTV